MINHYKSLRIDPKTKILVFSDGLDFDKAFEIYKTFYKEARISFGIGTYLTNNIPGVTPLQIVIKMTKCNGQPVAKLSDSAGKEMCKNEKFLAYLKSVFNV
jgi:nicotinate phosphoribosyltransferase